MNRQEIRNKARKKVGETTAAFWTDDEFNLWIDDACDDLVLRTLCLRGSATLTTVLDTAEYSLTAMISDVLAISDCQFYMDARGWYPLDPTTREELNKSYKGWRNATSGTPVKYYWDIKEDLLGLYPKPDLTNSGAYWLVYYAKRHTDISGDTATIDIPLELHKSIIEHVVATALETRGFREQAIHHWKLYEKFIATYMAYSDKNDHLDNDIIMIPGGRG